MEETGFTDSIERLTMTASLGCIAGIDVFNIDPVSDCFVLDEVLQLIVTPSAQYAVEPSVSTLSLDTFKVLHYDSSRAAVVFDNSFTDDVVHISHKMFPSATQSLEMPFGRFRSFTLETCLKPTDSFKSGFDPAIELPVGCNSEFAYTNINPNQVQAVSRLNVFGNKNMDKIIFTFSDNISTACSPVNIFQEVFRDANGYFNSTINSRYTDNAFIEFRPEVSDIVSDRNILHSFGFSVLCDDLNCFAGQLGWQFGFCPDNLIAFLVETFESSNVPMPECNLNGFIELGICFRNIDVTWKSNTDSSFGLHNPYIDGETVNYHPLKSVAS